MVTHSSQKRCRSGSALLLFLMLGLVYAPGLFSAQKGAGTTFYTKQKEGWFWYHDPVQEPEVKVKQPEQPEPPLQKPRPAQENKYRETDLEEYGIEELWGMYPDDFQELLDHVQNLAVQEPTEKNVLRYLVMQDVARRKALAYTNSSMYVTQKYGDLFNVNQVYPTSKPGVTARVQLQQQEIGKTIAVARNNHALISFTSPTCRFCERQNSILAYFVEKYGWQVKPVDISRQPGIAARFGIESTPTLLLIQKGREEYMTVSVGVVALTELERKLYRAIRYLGGETRDDNFLMYDFQKGSALDPTSILNQGGHPWKRD
ncbi:conjugal transfer protein TraF [Desulfogranum marinum]|uniref:conjugal transfer protein TraF n=1 Tax=Desulfogranum marinum TaxID=453220 RepID=UPI0019635CCD|nr:conjugal transfer protein TraF [Desulfogranum marinum]MBM9514072.1 conjugal transfer protein TraF [Desulfogranum marinum]